MIMTEKKKPVSVTGPQYRAYVCKDCKEHGTEPCFVLVDGVLAPSTCAFTFRLARWIRRGLP